MRELKFRVWDPNVDRMYTNVGIGKISNYDFDGDRITEQDGLIIMQYTGLKDRNGVEIYEGDILDFVEFDRDGADYRFKGVVKHEQGMWQVWRTWDDEFWGSDGAFYLWGVHGSDDGIEIVGNIHEHPHLLPKEEEPT